MGVMLREYLLLGALAWCGLQSTQALVPALHLRGGGAVASRIQYAIDQAKKEDVWQEGRLVEDPAIARKAREKRAERLGLSGGSAKPQLAAMNLREDVTDGFDEPELQEHDFDFDLIVIGGGSGGLACSKEAADLGAKVAVCDYVSPTPIGTTWGLGGTCVNVGCIPKKLMHKAALLNEAIEDAKSYGWEVGEGVKHDWKKMVNGVQDHIASLNFGYRSELRSKNVTYFNSLATFVDEHTIECTDGNGKKSRHTAAAFVVAVGGRPRYPGLPGDKECCITSDDLFSLPDAPGKTLVVGASYVALECAGFISGLGYDATVMMRSIPLRGFDMECSEKVCEYMVRHGTHFQRRMVPTRFEKKGKKVAVWFKNATGESGEASAEYDTVILAIGRYALSEQLGLDKIGVQVDADSLKIRGTGQGVGGHEQSSVEHIFALGDVLHARPELTPVAIQAGVLLARRLFGGAREQMDYSMVPTTVFTPLEYGCVGLSEEEAVGQLGEAGVEVYHALYAPLEWCAPRPRDHPRRQRLPLREDGGGSDATPRGGGGGVSEIGAVEVRKARRARWGGGGIGELRLGRRGREGGREEGGRESGEGVELRRGVGSRSPPSMEFPPRATRDGTRCFCKVICERGGAERIVGMHLVGENAGEIIQGFALGLKRGAGKADLDALVGVHPTGAEAFTTMAVSKRSGLVLQDKAC